MSKIFARLQARILFKWRDPNIVCVLHPSAMSKIFAYLLARIGFVFCHLLSGRLSDIAVNSVKIVDWCGMC